MGTGHISTNPLSTADYLSKLRSLAKNADSFQALRVVCGQVLERLQADASRTAQYAGGLYQIAVENNQKMPADLAFIGTVADDIAAKKPDAEKTFLENLNKAKASA